MRAGRVVMSATRAASVLVIAAMVMVVHGCGRDRADREYFAALEGEEKGMTREEQVAHLDRAIHLSPERAFYYDTRAGYYIDLRQFERARSDLDRSIELVPRPYAYFMRGLASCQEGEVARALADFDTAIARQPENGQFYRGRSRARAATGDAVGALQDALQLVAALPQQGESYYARGVARALWGHDVEAVADFDRALSIRPELVYVIEARAVAQERLGDVAHARADHHAAEQLRHEQSGCAPCLDPFRY
jgi:tetratricopeptide (TPR) repeat protein